MSKFELKWGDQWGDLARMQFVWETQTEMRDYHFNNDNYSWIL